MRSPALREYAESLGIKLTGYRRSATGCGRRCSTRCVAMEQRKWHTRPWLSVSQVKRYTTAAPAVGSPPYQNQPLDSAFPDRTRALSTSWRGAADRR